MCPRAGTKMSCRSRWLGFGTTTDTPMVSWLIKTGLIGRLALGPPSNTFSLRGVNRKRASLRCSAPLLPVVCVSNLLYVHGDEDLLSRGRNLGHFDFFARLRHGVAEAAADVGEAELCD